jgi:hypothetical protein
MSKVSHVTLFFIARNVKFLFSKLWELLLYLILESLEYLVKKYVFVF